MKLSRIVSSGPFGILLFSNAQTGFADAFLFSDGGFTVLNLPTGYVTGIPSGINDSGQIVGTNFSGLGDTAFLYTNGSSTLFGLGYVTESDGISNSGQIVGSYELTNVPGLPFSGAYLYSDGMFTVLPLPDTDPYAAGINDSGQIVGGTAIPNNNYLVDIDSHGFLYDDGAVTTFDVPGAFATFPTAINDSGQIVGYYYDASGNAHGFLDSNGTFSTIDVPGATSTFLTGINDSDQIVGYGTIGMAEDGFLYSNGIFTTIDYPGFEDTELTGINDNGQIIGYSDTPNPVAEPRSQPMLAACVIALFAMTWYRKSAAANSGVRDGRTAASDNSGI